MSGSGAGGGFDFQADAFAGVATRALCAHPLSWFDDFDDTPVAISNESGGPGDDLRIETPDGEIEVQVKHGLSRDRRFKTAVRSLFSGLVSDPDLRAVLLIDSTSSNPITNFIRRDVIRLSSGRRDGLHHNTQQLLAFLAQNGLTADNAIFSRFRIVVRDYEVDSADTEACVSELRGLLVEPHNARIVWDELGKEGHRLTRNRGRRDRASLFKMLQQKVELLGSADDLTPAASYFASFLKPDRLFHHNCKLVGRAAALKVLKDFEVSSEHDALLLTGRGGIGKSKLILEFANEARCSCWCLQSEHGISDRALTLIPRSAALVVIEDAHRIAGLKTVIQRIISTRPNAKILLSARSHSKDYVISSAVHAGIDVSRLLKADELKELSRSEVEELAANLLPNNLELAAKVARTTWDCPLVTVVAAELVKSESFDITLMANDERFRDAALTGLKEQFLGHASQGKDLRCQNAILDLIAALSPVETADNQLVEMMANFLDISPHELRSELGELLASGILIQRNTLMRIVPDVLSDHVLHSACCTHDGNVTGFSDSVFDTFGDKYTSAIVNNLAELDWRVRSSISNPPDLMSGIVNSLKERFVECTLSGKVALLETLSEAAYYIPLEIIPLISTVIVQAESQTSDSLRLRAVAVSSECLRKTAFTIELVGRSLELLWRLRAVEIHCSPSHGGVAHKVITDLAHYEVRKPYLYTMESINSAKRAVDLAADNNIETALKVIGNVLEKTSYRMYHYHNQIVTRSIVIRRDAARAARNTALEMLFHGLTAPALAKRMQCVRSLADTLRNPIPSFGLDLTKADLDQWVPEQLAIIQRLGEVLPTSEPLLVIQIVDAIAWHVIYENRPALAEAARNAARSVIDSFPLRFLRCIVRTSLGYWPCDFVDDPIPVHNKRLNRRDYQVELSRRVAKEMVVELPHAKDGFGFLKEQLSFCNEASVVVHMHLLFWHLADHAPDYAFQLCELIIQEQFLPAVRDVRSLLEPLARRDRVRGMKQLERLASGTSEMKVQAAHWLAHSDWFEHDSAACVDILRNVMAEKTIAAVDAVSSAILRLNEYDRSQALRLAVDYDVPLSREGAGHFARIFNETHGIPFAELASKDAQKIVSRLVEFPDIDNGHVGELLSQIALCDFNRVVQFFMRRIEHGQSSEAAYTPIPPRKPVYHVMPVPTGDEVRFATECIMNFAISGNVHLQRECSELLMLLTGGGNKDLLAALLSWVESGDPAQHRAAIALVSQFQWDFVDQCSEFVCRAFHQAEQLGEESLRDTDRVFYFLAANREKHGTAGQPFPQDLQLYGACQRVLARNDICLSARNFYGELMSSAEKEIQSQTDGVDFEL